VDESIFETHTALVAVDVQNDFADPEGAVYVHGGEGVVPVINRLVAIACAARSLVSYTQDWHPPSTPHFGTGPGGWPVHCIQGTWGAELHPGLEVAGPVIRKGVSGEDGYSAFTAFDFKTQTDVPTELDALLRDHGIEHVVVVGLARDVGVKETALDARTLGYHASIVLEATRAVDPTHDASAKDELRDAGVDLR
jgi:nicotinamidase/pyrazinamidase